MMRSPGLEARLIARHFVTLYRMAGKSGKDVELQIAGPTQG